MILIFWFCHLFPRYFVCSLLKSVHLNTGKEVHHSINILNTWNIYRWYDNSPCFLDTIVGPIVISVIINIDINKSNNIVKKKPGSFRGLRPICHHQGFAMDRGGGSTRPHILDPPLIQIHENIMLIQFVNNGFISHRKEFINSSTIK